MDPKSARLRPICGLVRRNGFIGCDATPRAILRSRRSDRHGDALSSTRRSRAGRSSCCGAGTGSVRSLPPTQSSVRSRADATRPIRVLTSSVRSAGESVDRCFLRTAANLAGPSSALTEKARLAERRLANPVDLDREMSRPAQRGILPVGGGSSRSRGFSSSGRARSARPAPPDGRVPVSRQQGLGRGWFVGGVRMWTSCPPRELGKIGIVKGRRHE